MASANTETMTTKNQSRPAAYISTKHIIMNAKDATDIKQAEKAIDNYIYKVCEKNLREERKLDLLYILNWRVGQLREAGVDVPDVQTVNMHEEPILNAHHQRLSK